MYIFRGWSYYGKYGETDYVNKSIYTNLFKLTLKDNMTYVFMIIPQICDKSFYAYQMTNKNRTIQRNSHTKIPKN